MLAFNPSEIFVYVFVEVRRAPLAILFSITDLIVHSLDLSVQSDL